MSNITLFDQAQLAEAAYATLTGAINDQDKLLAALNVANESVFGGSFSLSQATEFVKHWRVVDQYSNSEYLGLVGTGFSATVFERLDGNQQPTGEYSLAIRGSSDLADFRADTQFITTDGVAVSQLVELFNYWQSLTHSGQYQAAKLNTQELASTFLTALYLNSGANITAEIVNLFGDVNVPTTYDAARNYFIDQGYVVEGGWVYKVESDLSTNVFAIEDPLYSGTGFLSGQSVSLNGHSLGGHLAMAFSRLFPDAANDVTAINGLGFKIGDRNVYNLFEALRNASGTAVVPGFDASKIQNIYGLAGPEFAAMNNGVLQQPGDLNGIYIESATLPIGVALGHGTSQMTDSLAVANLFIRLDSTLAGKAPQQALAELNAILEKSSHLANQSLERTVISLRQLVLGEESPMAIQTDDREELYASIAGKDTLLGKGGDDTLIGGSGHDVLSGGTGNDVLMGGDGNDVYKFDAGDGIDVIEDLTGLDTLQFGAGITQEMISLGLGSLLINVGNNEDAIHIEGFNQNDVYGSGAIERFRFFNGELSYEELLAGGFDISGDDAANVITGTNIHDRIYGLAGDDELVSGEGNDLLDGGSGNDHLQGGDGNDAYIFGLGSGVDVIEDSSGLFDIVILQEGIHPDDLEITQEGDYIAISLKNTSDKLSIRWYDSDASKIEGIEFADGTSWDVETLESLAVPSNSAPILASSFADQHILEDAAFSYNIAGIFEDPDAGDVLSYSATLENGDPLPPWLSFDSDTLTFSGTPENANVVSLTLTVTATDEAGAFVSGSFNIDVTNTNDAPTVANAIADQAVSEDALFTFTVPADTFADVDLGDTLTYSASLADDSALPAWLSFDPETRVFSGTPENADVGNLFFKVSVTDAAGAAASSDFAVIVNNTNDAPVVANVIADQSTDEDALFSFMVPADSFTDVDLSDSLTYSATLADGSALPAWLSFDVETRTFSGTPENADVGSLNLRVTVTDAAGAAASGDFAVMVNNTNDAPILNGLIPNQTAYEGQIFSLQVGEDLFADVDLNDQLSYSATFIDSIALPAWLNFSASNLSFTGQPGNEDVGSWQIQLTATDLAGATTSTLFTLDLPRSSDQILIGDCAANILVGGTGHDTISGQDGSDELYGGAGNDTLNGGAGADLMKAGSGDDTLQFNVDALQILPVFTYNYGSPGNPGSGDAAFAILHWTSKDSFDGGTGTDTLNGTNSWDFIALDDQNGEARITGIEAIYAAAGHDVVNLTSTQNSYGHIYINGGDGNDVLWSNAGLDVLQGEAGWDQLDSGAGNGLLDGGTGNDTLLGGNDADFFIGGDDRDTLITGDGQDVIAFNVGDGVDSVYSTSGADNTISVGGNIDYADLSLKKSGKDLVLKVSNQDRIVLQDWYESGPSVATLQVIAEAMQGFNPDGSNNLMDNKVETFDFAAIVNKFDEVRSAHPFINNWSVADALLDFHLGGSDSAAIGGDLAYQYGKAGALTGISTVAAQSIIVDADFGKSAQTLQPLASLQEGLVKLG